MLSSLRTRLRFSLRTCSSSLTCLLLLLLLSRPRTCLCFSLRPGCGRLLCLLRLLRLLLPALLLHRSPLRLHLLLTLFLEILQLILLTRFLLRFLLLTTTVEIALPVLQQLRLGNRPVLRRTHSRIDLRRERRL